MKKETIKTIILSLLIINCIQLTAQIWLNEKLWPEGYNFFSYVESLPVISDVISYFNKNSSAGQIADTTTMPDKIIINGGGARVVTHSGNEEFFETVDFISPYIQQMFSVVTPTRITKQEWQTMLRGKSIYIDFGFLIDAKNLAAIFKNTVTGAPAFTNTNAVVLYPETVVNTTAICFTDAESGDIYKYTVANDTDKLLAYIEEKTMGKKHEHAYAFELRLDQDTESTSVQRKVALKSDVLLEMESDQVNKLLVTSIFEDEDAISTVADKILGAFGYKPSSLRKTVSQDGTVSYVENEATVKVYPSGLVEYDAVTTQSGIKITDAKSPSSTIIDEVLKIAQKVISCTETDETIILKLRTPLNETPVSSYTARFDRYYNGLPVIVSGNEKMSGNSLYAEVENGYIKSFRIQLKNLSLSEAKATPPTVINTIDRYFEKAHSDSTILIDNIFQCYYIDNDGEFSPRWCIKHDGVIAIP